MTLISASGRSPLFLLSPILETSDGIGGDSFTAAASYEDIEKILIKTAPSLQYSRHVIIGNDYDEMDSTTFPAFFPYTKYDKQFIKFLEERINVSGHLYTRVSKRFNTVIKLRTVGERDNFCLYITTINWLEDNNLLTKDKGKTIKNQRNITRFKFNSYGAQLKH